MASNIMYRVKDIKAGHDFTLTLDDIYRVYNKHCLDCNCKTIKGLHPQRPHSATMEHVVPLSEGGLHTMDNVILLCHKCNSKRNRIKQTKKKTYEFNMFGYAIKITKDIS